MDFIGQLLEFIFTPIGCIFLGFGLLFASQANQNRPILCWFSVSIFGFSASLGKFTNEFITEPPPLVFPLQQIREVGRPLTIILLLLLIFIGLKSKNIWRKKLIPQPMIYLALVQVIIFFKILFYGNILFAFFSIATFGGFALMIILGPSRWLQDDHNFLLGVGAIATTGIVFGLVNGYQAIIDIYPIKFVHNGWFLGTTGNPQHAAILITATVPAFLFLFFQKEKYPRLKWIWIGFLGVAIFGLLLTASRTGTIMTTVSVLIFFRYRGGKLLQILLIAGVITAFLIPDISATNADTSDLLSSTWDKWDNMENTREGVISGYWQQFLAEPFFGLPFQGDRLIFGESSWLGVLGSMGLIGTIPMVMFGWSSLQMIFKLENLSKTRPDYYLKCSVVMAGLLSLLTGSISEAYLLGNLTFALLAVFLYLTLGNYLIESAKRDEYFTLQDANGIDLNTSKVKA
jgi:hypothetical protein